MESSAETAKTPLLDHSHTSSLYTYVPSDQNSDSSQTKVTIKCKRKVIVEPLLLFYSVVTIPLEITLALYVYTQIEYSAAKELGLAHKGINISALQYCTTVTSSSSDAVVHVAQVRSSLFNVVTGVVSTVPCVLSTTFVGPYTDTAGRKIAFIYPLMTGFINVLVCLVIVQFKLSIWYLVIGSFIYGLGGRSNILITGCFAYIADTTKKEDLQFRITVAETIIVVPAALGPLGVTVLISTIGFPWIFLMFVVGHVIAIIYALFFIPETVYPDKDKPLTFWTTRHIMNMVRLFTKDTQDRRRWRIRWLMLAFIPVITVIFANQQISVLFVLNVPFCWSPIQLGVYFSTFIVVLAAGGIVSVKLLRKCLDEHWIALFSALSIIVKNVYNAFVLNTIMMYIVPALSIMYLPYIPTLRSLLSQLAGPNEQGALFGAIALAEVVCTFAGTFFLFYVYASTMYIQTGFVFLVVAMFVLLGCVILLLYILQLKNIYTIINIEPPVQEHSEIKKL